VVADAGELRRFVTIREAARSNPEIVLPYSAWDRGADTDAALAVHLGRGHPTFAVGVVLSAWLREGDIAATERRVGEIISHWDLDRPGTRLVYEFEWEILGTVLEPGWYSGMSDWSFMLLLFSLWQETGNPSYRQLGDRLLALAVSPVAAGGTIWTSASGCWLSEYAWPDIREDQESAVLNGHQYALVAVGLLATTLQDAELTTLFDTCMAGMRARLGEYRQTGDWPAYMLNPLSVNMVDYLMLEIALFDSLGSLSTYESMAGEAEWRRSALARQFPVFGDASADDERIMFTQIGPPHPYNLDWGTVTFRCSDGVLDEEFVMDRQRDLSIPISDRGFVDAPTSLRLEQTRCTVSTTLFGPEFRIFEAEVLLDEAPPIASSVAGYRIASTLNMASWSTDRSFGVPLAEEPDDPSDPYAYLDAESRIVLEFDEPLRIEASDLFVVEVGSSARLPVSVTLHSETGDCFRYYPALERSPANAVLLSTLGFVGCGADVELSGLTLTFARTDLAQPVRVSVGRVIVFDSRLQMRRWFADTQATLPDDGGLPCDCELSSL
jgi:hypothetical protein